MDAGCHYPVGYLLQRNHAVRYKQCSLFSLHLFCSKSIPDEIGEKDTATAIMIAAFCSLILPEYYQQMADNAFAEYFYFLWMMIKKITP